ncbi:MAG: ABC transporter ATP-binding protein [Clostridia bacterium]|nr:ABC transporter ATP-binding protein [Clostridia bacterium]
MKLMFDLPPADEAVIPAPEPGEKRMYCLPFNYLEGMIVKGYMLFTNRHIYKVLEGLLLNTWDVSRMSEFTIEQMFGCSGLYAHVDGKSHCLCLFNSGRNLPRYSVVLTSFQAIVEEHDETILTSEEPERFCPKCGRPFVQHTTICPFCQDKKKIYKKLWGMTRGLRLLMFFPLGVALLSLVFRFVVPAIQRVAIDEYIIPQNDDPTSIRSFILIIVAIVSIDLIQRAVGVVQSRISATSANRFTLMLRSVLFEKIQTLSLSSVQKKSTGDLMGRINNDVAVVQNFITNLLPSYLSMLFSFVFALVILLVMSPLMSLFVFIPIPFALTGIILFRKTVNRRNVRAWILTRRTDTHLQDTLDGIRVVKSYGNEEKAVRDFKANTTKQARQEESNASLFDTVFPLFGFLLRFGNYLILLFGNLWVFGGTMTIGELNQFNTYASIIYEPILQITVIPRSISAFSTSLGKILEILEEEPEIYDAPAADHVKLKGEISIRNVTFGYFSYHPILKHINVDIKKGEMIGIVGHSGCGKTTLINLIMRLYDVTQGAIYMDGKDIREISQDSLRTQMGVVLQETHLFSGSVRDNLKYAMPQATNEEVIRAAKLANAHDFIMRLPEGYNSMVGEKGYSLSGGERQRIAIARALIHDPALLILDEATAALDTETEKLIQDAIDRVAHGRTTLVIAHRLSTLRNADRILVLDHGKVAEFGTHLELLQSKGIYYKLVMSQARQAQEKD